MYTKVRRKITTIFITMVALLLISGTGAAAFADECCPLHDNNRMKATGGVWAPEITEEPAPSVSEKDIEAADKTGEAFSLSDDQKPAGKTKKSAKAVTKNEGGSPSEDLSDTIFDSPDDAVSEVRKALVKGSENAEGIKIKLRIDLDYWNDADLSAASDWNAFFNSEEWKNYHDDGLAVLGKAVSYTGNAKEGDYLTYRFRSASIGHGFPQHGGYAPDGSGREFMEWNFTIRFFTTGSQEQEVDSLVEEVLEDLDLERKSDLEKIKAIYGWVATEVAYDFENLNDDSHWLKYTAYAAIKDGKAVCQGYSALLYRMMLEAGIQCRIVSGSADGEGHAWNAVKVGTRWYYLDSTWDYGYDEVEWQYFLKGRNDFEGHTPESKERGLSSYWKDPADPNCCDYDYADAKWFVKYPVPDGRFYQDSSDPDCVHTWNEGKIIQEKKCITPELTEKSCTKCGAKNIESTKQGTPHVGMSNTFEEIDATCTQDGGYTNTCVNCGEKYYVYNPAQKPALGHDYGAATPLSEEDPDYEKKHIRVCSRDGSHVLKQRHKWDEGEITTPVTDIQDGVRTFTCTECNVTKKETIPAQGHTHDWKDATCTEAKKCKTCGTEEGNPLGHDWKEATCTEAKKCKTCGSEEGNPLGHDWDDTTGNCERCGESNTLPINIQDAEIVLSATEFTYDGKVKMLIIKTVGGMALADGTEYTVKIENSKGDIITLPKAAGTYTLHLTGTGKYTGTAKVSFTINKAANSLKVKGKTASVKYKKLKKKTQTIKRSKAVTVSKARGKVTYKKSTVAYTKAKSVKMSKKALKKYKKAVAKKIKINTKTGKVTVKKGLKKGTYKVKVKIKAAGNANYKASKWKTVTFKIKLK